jgi:carboxymethylenebutenolidase
VKRVIVGLATVMTAAAVTAAVVKDFGRDRLNTSPRHGDWVDIKSGERTVNAWLVYPERKEKAPVVIVIHEIFGLTDWARALCDELAEAGVIAIAPNLLGGDTKLEDVDAARKAIAALPDEQVVADLNAVADYASTTIPAASGSLAVCGFCWGGGKTIAFANANPKLKAAYSFYGPPPDTADKIQNIGCPLYGFYGEQDERVDAGIPKLTELMKAAGKTYEPVIYHGAGHGFMRSGEPNDPHVREADKKAREEAWARWRSLLKQL